MSKGTTHFNAPQGELDTILETVTDIQIFFRGLPSAPEMLVQALPLVDYTTETCTETPLRDLVQAGIEACNILERSFISPSEIPPRFPASCSLVDAWLKEETADQYKIKEAVIFIFNLVSAAKTVPRCFDVLSSVEQYDIYFPASLTSPALDACWAIRNILTQFLERMPPVVDCGSCTDPCF